MVVVVLIHSVLVPSTKFFNFHNRKRMCTRFSIRDSQKSFIMEGSTVAKKRCVVRSKNTNFVFNLEYPKESSLVWTFIQKYFYSISTNCDCDSPQINILISNLNNI